MPTRCIDCGYRPATKPAIDGPRMKLCKQCFLILWTERGQAKLRAYLDKRRTTVDSDVAT